MKQATFFISRTKQICAKILAVSESAFRHEDNVSLDTF